MTQKKKCLRMEEVEIQRTKYMKTNLVMKGSNWSILLFEASKDLSSLKCRFLMAVNGV